MNPSSCSSPGSSTCALSLANVLCNSLNRSVPNRASEFWHVLRVVCLLLLTSLTHAFAQPFTPTGSLTTSRQSHTATLLPNGKVFFAGGYSSNYGGSPSAELYDPATGAFTATGSLKNSRYYHTATLLPNGKVLLVGGASGSGGVLGSAELYDPATGVSTLTGSLTTTRYYHTATLLPNGKVLVAGGFNTPNGTALASAELYDPATGTFSVTGLLATGRYAHTATLLSNGKVLVAGGYTSSVYLSSAELYDPATGTFSATGSLNTARTYHSATLLNSGQVLFIGGYNGSSGPVATAELYDAATGTFSYTGSLTIRRYWQSAVLLSSGKVLVTGGFDNGVTGSAELYDPSTGTFAQSGSLTTGRYSHTSTLLGNGKVLVAGGSIFSASTASAELYEPVGRTFPPTGSMSAARGYHTATLLPGGKVLLAGGNSNDYPYPRASAQLYNVAAGTFTATGSLATARYVHTATLLPNGKVLIVGGTNGYTGPSVLATNELYDPATGTFTATGSLAFARTGHTATLLPNGKVLIVGGGGSSTTLSSAELYDPQSGTFSTTGSLRAARSRHTATLLPNGKVLIAGGYASTDNYGGIYLSSAELYDPATGTFSPTGTMTNIRSDHSATLLNNGKVLLVGGNVGGVSTNATASAELYDPSTGIFSATAPLSVMRYGHTATLLPSGKVLVAGGYGSNYTASVELYDPATGLWTVLGSMIDSRAWHTATLLPNNKVLMAGGQSGFYLARAELYAPNSAPIIASLSISPASPTTSSILSAVLVASDPDGDAFTTSYIWTKNGTILSGQTGQTLNLATPGNGDKGDVIGVSVTVADSAVSGRVQQAAPVTVVNSAPVVTGVSITPQSALTGMVLTANATTSDPDGDALTISYVWKKNDTVLTGETESTLDLAKAGNGDKGDSITVTVTASDRTTSTSVPSASTTIGNSAPVVNRVSITPTDPTTNTILTATAQASDVDGDALTISYIWKKNGAPISGQTGASLDLSKAGNGGKSDSITVTVTATDGTTASAPASADAVTIGNSAPILTAVSLTPTAPTTNATLTATITASDDDEDSLSYTYAWKKNDVLLSGATGPTLKLSEAGNGDKGDSITVTVTATDGTASTNAVTSAAVTVGNSAPVVNSATLAPANPLTYDTLTATVQASDADGDTLSYSYLWKKNGTIIAGETSSTLDLSKSGNGDDGDTITVTITATDGTDSSAPSTSSSVTVGNLAPVVVSLSPSSGSDGVGTKRSFTLTMSDANGASDIREMWLLINRQLDWTDGATLIYRPNASNPTSGQLFLRSGNDFLAPIQIGQGASSSAVLDNGAVRILATDVTVSVADDGNSITVTLPLTIRNGLVGQNRLFARAQDSAGAVDAASQPGDLGFIRFGAYNVASQFAGTVNSAPTLSKLTPGATSTTLNSAGVAPNAQTFGFFVQDANGIGDIEEMWFMANKTRGWAGSATFVYYPRTRRLVLRSDDGNSFLGGGIIGTPGIIENSQVRVDLSKVKITIYSDGKSLGLTLPLQAKRGLVGQNKVWLRVQDLKAATAPNGDDLGFVQSGTWNVTQATATKSAASTTPDPSAAGS